MAGLDTAEAAKKKPEAEEKKPDDKGAKPGDKPDAASAGSEKSLVTSFLDTTKEKASEIYAYFAGTGTDSAATKAAVPDVTVVNSKGQPVDGQGRVLDQTPVGLPKDQADTAISRAADSSSTGWEYAAWAKLSQPSPELNIAQRVADWVGKKMDRFMTGPTSYESTDAKGTKFDTTVSGRGVDHVGSDGTKTHVDERGAIQTNAAGDTHFSQDGKVGEQFRNGSQIVNNPDGSYDVTHDGQKVHVNKDGTVDEVVNGHHIKITAEGIERYLNGTHFRQHRQGDNGTGEQCADASKPTTDGKPAVTMVEDPQDHSQMVVINDGKGNIVKLRKNGERILTSADNPGMEIIAKDGDPNVRMKVNGEDFYLRRLQGTDNADRWYVYRNQDGSDKGGPVGWIEGDGKVYKYDANDRTKRGALLGRVAGLGTDGQIDGGTAKVDEHGRIRMAGLVANVELLANGAKVTGPDGQVAVTTDQSGQTSEVTVTGRDNKTEATTTNPGANSFTSKVDVQTDANGAGVIGTDGAPVGGHTMLANDGKDPNAFKIGIGDRDGDGHDDFIDAHINRDGVSMLGPDGTSFDGLGNMCLNNGDIFHGSGGIDFADGTSIDAHGKVKYGGTAVGGEVTDPTEAATIARVSAILGAAASISSSGSLDPGKIGQLMSLFAELGAAQGAALQANDLGAFMQADLAKAVVSGAISEQQAAQARQTLAQYFVDHPLSTDELARLQNGGARSMEEVTKK